MDGPDPAPPVRPPVILAGRRNFVLAAIYFSLWLVPIVQAGFTCQNARGMPKYLTDMYRVACLFTERVPAWSNYYIQVRLRGQMEWRDVPKTDYSSMPPFGHRTRFDHLITESAARNNGAVIREEFSDFVKKRYELLHPDEPEIAGVRFIRARYSVGEPIIAKPKSHWVVPPLDSVEEWRRVVVYTRSFEDQEGFTFGDHSGEDHSGHDHPGEDDSLGDDSHE